MLSFVVRKQLSHRSKKDAKQKSKNEVKKDKKQKSLDIVVDNNQNILKTSLWCSSSFIPFCNTKEYNELFEWCQNFTQFCPSCLLYGPTSSGKSRAIEQIALKLLYHIVEIDCAAISSVKELVVACEESTKSKSLGIFCRKNESQLDKASSIVVLEHIDSLIPLHNDPSAALINLVSKSRVPLIMTSQRICFSPAEWLKIIPFEIPSNPFDIIKSASWISDEINNTTTNQEIHSLLSFTDNDIRASALQYQVWNNNSNSRLTRHDQIYLSIPTIVQEKDDPKLKRETYADLCDLLLIIDEDDQFFDNYIRPLSETFMSKSRELKIQSYADYAKEKIPHSYFGEFEDIAMITLTHAACVHSTQITRNRAGPSIYQPHNIKPYEVPIIKNWKVWENIENDLPPLEPSQIFDLNIYYPKLDITKSNTKESHKKLTNIKKSQSFQVEHSLACQSQTIQTTPQQNANSLSFSPMPSATIQQMNSNELKQTTCIVSAEHPQMNSPQYRNPPPQMIHQNTIPIMLQNSPQIIPICQLSPTMQSLGTQQMPNVEFNMEFIKLMEAKVKQSIAEVLSDQSIDTSHSSDKIQNNQTNLFSQIMKIVNDSNDELPPSQEAAQLSSSIPIDSVTTNKNIQDDKKSSNNLTQTNQLSPKSTKTQNNLQKYFKLS